MLEIKDLLLVTNKDELEEKMQIYFNKDLSYSYSVIEKVIGHMRNKNVNMSLLCECQWILDHLDEFVVSLSDNGYKDREIAKILVDGGIKSNEKDAMKKIKKIHNYWTYQGI